VAVRDVDRAQALGLALFVGDVLHEIAEAGLASDLHGDVFGDHFIAAKKGSNLFHDFQHGRLRLLDALEHAIDHLPHLLRVVVRELLVIGEP
jgi:hypothetical protein